MLIVSRLGLVLWLVDGGWLLDAHRQQVQLGEFSRQRLDVVDNQISTVRAHLTQIVVSSRVDSHTKRLDTGVGRIA